MKISTGQQVNGVKVFSATMARDRADLGELITTWMRAHQHFEIVDKIVTQSSDEAFHCLAITIMYFDPDAEARVGAPSKRNGNPTATPAT